MFGPPPRHNTVTTVQFASTARVLGVWAADGEAGCDMGHFIARCSTESGNSKWDLGSNSHDGWQVRTTWDNDGGASVRQFGTAWLQPGYINSAFVNASEQTDRGNSLRDIASAMMARGPDVCRYVIPAVTLTLAATGSGMGMWMEMGGAGGAGGHAVPGTRTRTHLRTHARTRTHTHTRTHTRTRICTSAPLSPHPRPCAPAPIRACSHAIDRWSFVTPTALTTTGTVPAGSAG